MPSLDIEKTSTSPRIRYDAATCTLLMVGESYPENSFEFFEPVLACVREALAESSTFTFDIDVSYMNSSSTKCILDLLDLMEEAAEKGTTVTVTWRYDTDNPRALDLAEEFREEVTFPFNLLPR
ncbi:protein of unknown function DUF1987-containing protein [Desulfovibrio sp. X2]|uniref:DUF1987 domain-containing protein n=1 Tax=Desulfovibrio sp. X2 TaxID=941449 RepID=UPI0003588F9E|nr:DUF1987 domain-containing protein [Desulfovibrio sp. X2]EPR37682.1 protein of unknown function DUF1987-containing protein [Desulfovibrio sp. X2]